MAMEGMRAILRGSLDKSLSGLSETDRLSAAWRVACGRTMAEHGEIVSIFQGTVTIVVTDEAWLRQMMSMRGLLQHELARMAGVELTGIHFKLKKR